MLKFRNFDQIEHKYAFEDAVAGADTFNGAFGAVTAGSFAVTADGTKVIMQAEDGDNAGLPKYPITKGEHVRVLDLTKLAGEELEIYDYPLPDTVAVGNKLTATADGALKVNSSTGTKLNLEVKSVIGNKQGVVVVVNGATA